LDVGRFVGLRLETLVSTGGQSDSIFRGIEIGEQLGIVDTTKKQILFVFLVLRRRTSDRESFPSST
jgi:hypothetical protein